MGSALSKCVGLCCEGKDESPTAEVELSKEVGAEGKVRNMSAHYVVHYPAHGERKASSVYTKTHRGMKDTACFICGKSRKEGVSVESHHFYVEKVFEGVIDWEKFGAFASKSVNMQTGMAMGGFDWLEVAKNPELFVDSSANMIGLCQEHHRSGGKGIHHVPFPDWIAQKFAKEGFEVLM